MFKHSIYLSLLVLALATSCAVPANLVYFQDTPTETSLKAVEAEPIRLKPMDQFSVVVNSRDPQLAAMFNLPYYTKRLGDAGSMSSGAGNVNSANAQMSGYTVDSQGNIDFPVLGPIHVAGLTREEAEIVIKEELIESGQIKDPVVIIEFMNLGFSVLGEVTRPGRYRIDRDRFTLFDALGLAGDLTINGERENVTLVRHDGKEDVLYRLNLLDIEELYASPAFYVQQGDMIYVTPNEKRRRESTVNGNNIRSTSFWISIGSLASSITTLLISALK